MDDKNDYIHQKRKKTEQEESVDDNALPVTKKHFLLTAITQEDIDDGKFQEIPLSALNQEEEEVEEEEEVWERLPSEYDVIELSD